MTPDEVDEAFAQARAQGGRLVYVSAEIADVERTCVLLMAGAMARLREWPSGHMWTHPLAEVHLVDRPTGAPISDEGSRAAARDFAGTAGPTSDYEPLGEPLTIDTMTAALTDGAHPWVLWDDAGRLRIGMVDGFLPDDVGMVRVSAHPDGAKVRVLVGRLSLFRGKSIPFTTMLERVSATPDGGPAPVRPSDAQPYITAQAAPVNAAGARWVPPDAYDTAMRERDDAVDDATRSRRLLWLVLRGIAISEAQAAAWLSLLLEGDPTG